MSKLTSLEEAKQAESRSWEVVRQFVGICGTWFLCFVAALAFAVFTERPSWFAAGLVSIAGGVLIILAITLIVATNAAGRASAQTSELETAE